MDSSSLLTSLLTSLAIFEVLMLLYTLMANNPRNDVMYYSNRILKGMDPWEGYGSRTRNPFSWIKEALISSEAEMFAISGVDTAVYFVFLSTVLGILVLSGIILLPILLPVAAKGSSGAGIDKYSKIISLYLHAKSSRLWAFMVAVYWVSLVSYYLLWKACKHVSELRDFSRRESNAKDREYVILVRDIPPLPLEFENRKQQVDYYFRSIHPNTFYSSIVVTDNTKEGRVMNERIREAEAKQLHQ
ncbi:hypothetical protein V2J09_010204 [Rumex salicifolius]